ncbi:HoxN/HupN/NixA family nickel/cobalt transporter [Streptomyces sp. YIM S03343]
MEGAACRACGTLSARAHSRYVALRREGQPGRLGAGLGGTTYVPGMRHVFDVDHIAVVDNATRKLVSAGQRPLSV